MYILHPWRSCYQNLNPSTATAQPPPSTKAPLSTLAVPQHPKVPLQYLRAPKLPLQYLRAPKYHCIPHSPQTSLAVPQSPQVPMQYLSTSSLFLRQPFRVLNPQPFYLPSASRRTSSAPQRIWQYLSASLRNPSLQCPRVDNPPIPQRTPTLTPRGAPQRGLRGVEGRLKSADSHRPLAARPINWHVGHVSRSDTPSA